MRSGEYALPLVTDERCGGLELRVLVVLGSLGNRRDDLAQLGNADLHALFTHQHLRAYQGAFAIDVAANVSATSVSADLPSMLVFVLPMINRWDFTSHIILLEAPIISQRTRGLEIGMRMQGT